MRTAAEDRRRGGERAGVDDHVLGGDAPIGERPPERAPRATPGTTPARDATRASRSVSQPIMRRTWRGVAAMARRSAISRSRSWTASPSVLATTNIAMSIASPPKVPAIAMTASRASATPRSSAPPRALPVRTRARAGGGADALAQARAVGAGCRDDPDCVRAAGVAGQSRRLGVRDEHDRGRWTAVRGAAMPTTVADSAGPVAARRTRSPTRRPPAGREAGVDDDLAARPRRASGAQAVGGEGRRAPRDGPTSRGPPGPGSPRRRRAPAPGRPGRRSRDGRRGPRLGGGEPATTRARSVNGIDSSFSVPTPTWAFWSPVTTASARGSARPAPSRAARTRAGAAGHTSTAATKARRTRR